MEPLTTVIWQEIPSALCPFTTTDGGPDRYKEINCGGESHRRYRAHGAAIRDGKIRVVYDNE